MSKVLLKGGTIYPVVVAGSPYGTDVGITDSPLGIPEVVPVPFAGNVTWGIGRDEGYNGRLVPRDRAMKVVLLPRHGRQDIAGTSGYVSRGTEAVKTIGYSSHNTSWHVLSTGDRRTQRLRLTRCGARQRAQSAAEGNADFGHCAGTSGVVLKTWRVHLAWKTVEAQLTVLDSGAVTCHPRIGEVLVENGRESGVDAVAM